MIPRLWPLQGLDLVCRNCLLETPLTDLSGAKSFACGILCYDHRKVKMGRGERTSSNKSWSKVLRFMIQTADENRSFFYSGNLSFSYLAAHQKLMQSKEQPANLNRQMGQQAKSSLLHPSITTFSDKKLPRNTPHIPHHSRFSPSSQKTTRYSLHFPSDPAERMAPTV